jgi:hypothetical protein
MIEALVVLSLLNSIGIFYLVSLKSKQAKVLRLSKFKEL